MEFNIKVEGIDKVINELNDISKRQLPFALARALTQTAKAIQEDEKKEMKQTFDRPTPFTLNSLRIEPATKTNLKAIVAIKDKAVSILSPHIFGGERGIKRFEFHLRRAGILPQDKYVTPGACAPLDRYGNIPGGIITRILSALKAHPDIYAWRTARSIKRRRGRVVKYVVIPEGKKAHAGIYEREGNRIKPIMMFVRKPLYSKRFRFFEIAQLTAERRFQKIFDASLADAIARPK
jgi:hypothetical protein